MNLRPYGNVGPPSDKYNSKAKDEKLMHCPTITELPPPPAGYTGWPWTAEGIHLPDKMPNGFDWPRISIITPSYNQVEYLEATIRSILLQGYPDLEYIVMDGGSTDGSLDIIKRYSPWLSHWESGTDSGQYAAIEKGFGLSNSEIMAWLNSDDMYFPWTLKTIGEVFGNFLNIDWLTTSNTATTAYDGSTITFLNQMKYSRRWFSENRNLRKTNGFIQQESTFWRHSLWKKAGGMMESQFLYAGDFELWARFYKYTGLVTTNTPLGIFRYHPGQKTRVMDRYIEEAEIVLKKIPRPIFFPEFLLKVLRFPFKYLNSDVDWFGTKCDQVRFDPQLNQWLYVKSFT